MASFVHFVDGLAGTTQRAFAVGQQLRDRGHEVVLASPVDLSADADRADVAFVHLEGTQRRQAERAALPRPGRSDLRPSTTLRWLRTGRRLRRESLADREIESVLDRVDPDLVLVDHEFHTAGLACRARNQPFVLVSGVFSTLRSDDNAPLHTALVPGAASPEALAAAWERTLGANRRTWRTAMRSPARLFAPFRPVQLMTSNVPDIAAFARARGLRLASEVTGERWLRPFTVARADTISLTPSSLEWAPPDPRWRTLGLVAAPTPIDRTTAQDRSTTDALLASRNTDTTRPLVYASVGTFWSGAEATIRLIVDALGRLEHVDAVVGLGSLLDPGDLDPAPNVRVLSWAPQIELLHHADLAIVHGGITSIGECLVAGVPMVLASTHTNDQDGTVARCVEAGVAVAVDHRTINAEHLAEQIDRALADDELRARLLQIGADVRDEAEELRVVSFLEQRVSADG